MSSTAIPPGPVFTANQLAAALGCTGRAVRKRLEKVVPAGEIQTRGGRSPGWTLTQLPGVLLVELQKNAALRGYRDVAALLTDPPPVWQPKHARVAPKYQEKALKLREAMRGTLRRLNDMTIKEAEFRERGLAEYKAVFGHAISEKQWKRLVDRTTDRDRGAEDWERLEIYFEEKCAPLEASNTTDKVVSGATHPNLQHLISSFAVPAHPSKTEEILLWQSTFDPSSTVSRLSFWRDPVFMRVCGQSRWLRLGNVVQLLRPQGR